MKTNKKYFWYGLIAVIVGSLNATFIKYASDSVNTFSINFIRYSLAALVALPFFLKSISKLTRRGLCFSILSGICLFLASTGYVSAIELSKATYVTLLTLVTPVIMVIFSIKMTNDKVDAKRLAGFSLAALGALLVVAGPLALSGNTSIDFYPLATLFASLMILAYPLSVIFARKANESRKKLPIVTVLFIQTATIAGLSLVFGSIFGKIEFSKIPEISPWALLAISYSGIMVGLVDRGLNIKSYEKVGSAVNGGLGYLGIFLSITISVSTLGEEISLVALIGGAIILLGVVLTEHRLPKRHRHNLHAHHNH